MIRSSKHSLKYTNQNKRDNLSIFLTEYRRLLQVILDDLWENGLESFFNIQKNQLKIPSFLPNDYLKKHDSWLTARMKQGVGKQVCSMLKAAVKKRSQQFYVLKKLQRKSEPTPSLQKAIDIQPLVKPNSSNAKPELDSRFVDFKESSSFDLFIRVKTIGKKISLLIPINQTRVGNKWTKRGIRKTSIRLSEENLYLFYDCKKAKKKTHGSVVGADQGITTALTLSDTQVTKSCPHGHTLSSIQKKLSRRRKGSFGFQRAVSHRLNYVNWSLNQLDFSSVKELRFEKVKHIRRNRRSSRFLSHWTYPLIKQKLTSISETEGFRIVEVDSQYRSQRCSNCGWVRKANRRQKLFSCNRCNFVSDADLNASLNLRLDLFEIPKKVRLRKLNRDGFYWNSEGLFLVNQERIVPDIPVQT